MCYNVGIEPALQQLESEPLHFAIDTVIEKMVMILMFDLRIKIGSMHSLIV